MPYLPPSVSTAFSALQVKQDSPNSAWLDLALVRHCYATGTPLPEAAAAPPAPAAPPVCEAALLPQPTALHGATPLAQASSWRPQPAAAAPVAPASSGDASWPRLGPSTGRPAVPLGLGQPSRISGASAAQTLPPAQQASSASSPAAPAYPQPVWLAAKPAGSAPPPRPEQQAQAQQAWPRPAASAPVQADVPDAASWGLASSFQPSAEQLPDSCSWAGGLKVEVEPAVPAEPAVPDAAAWAIAAVAAKPYVERQQQQQQLQQPVGRSSHVAPVPVPAGRRAQQSGNSPAGSWGAAGSGSGAPSGGSTRSGTGCSGGNGNGNWDGNGGGGRKEKSPVGYEDDKVLR